MRLLQGVGRFIVYSNIWVGLAAVAMAFQTCLEYGLPDESYIYLIFLFSSTVGLYISHRLIGLRRIDSQAPIAARLHYATEYKILTYIILCLSAIGSLLSFIFLSSSVQVLVALGSLLGVLYVVPMGKRGIRLRDLPYVKIFVIGISWAILCGLIPIFIAKSSVSVEDIPVIIEIFIYVVLVTLPFDYRDRQIDQEAGLNTLANSLEPGLLRSISFGLAFGGLAIIFLLAPFAISNIQRISWFFIYCLTGVVVIKSYRARSEMWYSGLVEGLLIIRPLVFILVASIHD